jgi:hypothetical protein
MKIAKIIILLLLFSLLPVMLFSLWVNTDWEVEHRLEIDASPEVIWQLLIDFENYPNWNRYSPTVTGKFGLGERVIVEANLDGNIQRVENYIVAIKPQQELCWQSEGWYAAMSQGLRCRWLVEQDSGKTLLIHHEIMAGYLAWLIEWALFEEIQSGLQLVNESLAAEAVRISQ